MGLLSFFNRPEAKLQPLPAGSFTVDREGKILTSTLPRSYPAKQLLHVGEAVLASFRSAKKAQEPLTEIVIQYSSFKILARELRGGAIIFLTPLSIQPATRNPPSF